MFKKFLLIIFLLLITASCLFYYYLDKTYKNISDINILFVLEDNISENDKRPILLLSQFFADTKKLQFIFINEDIAILSRTAKTKTVFQSYSQCANDKKIDVIKKDIEYLFENRVKIDYFINIDKQTFKNFFTIFEKDKQLDEALFPHTIDKTNYYDYIYSNIVVVKSIIKLIDRTKLIDILLFIKNNTINTDIKFKNLLYLLNIGKINPVFADIPTIKNKGRIEIDRKNKENFISLLKNNYKSNPFLSSKTIVEVLNASNKKRAASKVANKLIENGFDVFNWANSSIKTNNTLIIDLINDEQQASKICKLFDCGEVLILPAPKNFTDMLFLIGKDCNIFDKFDIDVNQENL